VGDFSFILGLFWLFWALGDQATLKFSELEKVIAAQPELVGGAGGLAVTAICLLFFGGATGKSAQVPLYVWLPDAMAGPTPVSALIHAATMVTSGIYMICRLNFLFALSPVAMGTVATVGAITALLAATIAISQNDIKKVLAYSTVSQLGYMFLGVGIGAFTAGFFHVITHAFFKALLFLGSGAIIHALHHEQDMRNMGGLRKKMPITFAIFVVGWLSIIGFPGFSGFFSKDEILWLVWSTPASQIALFGADFPLPRLLWVIGALTAVLTAFYMSRMMFMTFWGEYRGGHHGHGDHGHGDAHGHHGHHEPHEVGPILYVPLLVLALLSAVGGALNLPHWFPAHDLTGKLHHFLEPLFHHAPMRFDAADPSEEIPLMLGTLSLIAVAVGLAAWLYAVRPKDSDEVVAELPTFVVEGSRNKWWVDEIYEAVLIKPLVLLSRHGLWQIVDAGLIDGAVNGAGAAARTAAAWYSRSVQIGQIQAYALAMATGTAFIVIWFALSGFGA
jgi:NADH-quinone oxidoreductase subunit L